MTTIAMIQARMSSSRLPGKVLMDLNGQTVLQYIVSAAQRVKNIDKVVVVTSTEDDDNAIQEWCSENNVECYRDSLHDVLKRYFGAAQHYNAETIIRLTADCPLLDPSIIEQLIVFYEMNGADYCSNVALATWPDGMDCEIFSMSSLKRAHEEATLPEDREHVTRYIHRNRSIFDVRNLPCPLGDLSDHRWTLDTPQDFEFLKQLLPLLPKNPSYTDILSTLKTLPKLDIKNNQPRVTIKQSSNTNRSYERSQKLLERAEKTIPLGTQTFSKSRLSCAPGHAPLFASHGRGGRIWDVDGNEYIDMVMGLLPTSLGYADPDIDHAIKTQLDKGITFSLATELEYRLAEKITEHVPCAEKVRFGKNGSDATSAAIRLARAFTDRDHIIVCGYHGWQDWYIGSTARHKGVPQAVRDLTHKVDFNDLDQVEALLNKHPNKFAALIMEPMNVALPNENYLQDLKTLLHKHDTLLIFDEVITGFRYAIGGAQEYFGVTPDLTALGKGMANGMPLSAITGRNDVMDEMENIFFSGTFGGEALSLAASIAVIDKIKNQPVIQTLWKSGETIKDGLDRLFSQHGLSELIKLCGLAPWQILQFASYGEYSPAQIKTFFVHELFKRGVLSFGSYNICYAHSAQDIQNLLQAHDNVLSLLKTHLQNKTLSDYMDYPTIQPVFEVRKNA